MHPTSLENMQYCVDHFVVNQPASYPLDVIDIGGANIGGTFSDIFVQPEFQYRSVDIDPDANVDIVLEDPYELPFDDDSVDMVISGQVFEHVEFFWLLFEEMARVVKPSGLLILIVPSSGYIHRYPVDCYRFNPDAMDALAKYTGLLVLEKWQDSRGPWCDVTAVFGKQPRTWSQEQHAIPANPLRSHDGYLRQYAAAPGDGKALSSDALNLLRKLKETGRDGGRSLSFYLDTPVFAASAEDAAVYVGRPLHLVPHCGLSAAYLKSAVRQDEALSLLITSPMESLRTLLNLLVAGADKLAADAVVAVTGFYPVDRNADVWKFLVLLNHKFTDISKCVVDDGDKGMLLFRYRRELSSALAENYNPWLKTYQGIDAADYEPVLVERRYAVTARDDAAVRQRLGAH